MTETVTIADYFIFMEKYEQKTHTTAQSKLKDPYQ